MVYLINVIGCDGVSDVEAQSEEVLEYIECKKCLNIYNDVDCKTFRLDMQLKLIFG